MLTNYLKIAVRNLLRHKTYSLINMLGLAAGICVSTLILMFVVHEHSYDRFHARHGDIYRVLAKVKMGDNDFQMNSFASGFAPSIAAGVPHVKDYVRILPSYRNTVMGHPARKGEAILEKNVLFADPSFFSVFTFPLEKGNAADALQKPFTMVVSERAARKYFGNADPVGQALLYEGKHLIQIAGVAKNPPSNSSFDFDFVISNATYPKLSEMTKNNWDGGGIFNVYLQLDFAGAKALAERGINRGESAKAGLFEGKTQYFLESLDDIHLGGAFTDSGNNKLIPIFSMAAAAVLMLALFNYMSLTTARATQRAREVGVRKVVGATRAGLGKQFYIESVLVCVLAFALGLAMVYYLSQPFYELLGLKVDASFVISPFFLSFLMGLLLVTTLVAGSYPAFILSGFAPLEVLKGRFKGNIGGVGVRRFFIVFQFSVSIALIMASLVVKEQLGFMQRKDLGLYKEQVLSIPLGPSMAANYKPFRDAVKQQAGVTNVTFANVGLFKGYNMFFVPNIMTKKQVGLAQMVVDGQFIKTLGLKWKAAPTAGARKNQTLLNELAVRELGIRADPIGQQIMEGVNVDGILEDFDFSSLQHGTKAVMLSVASDTTNMLRMPGSSRGVMYVRLDTRGDIAGNVKAIGRIFESFDHEMPFEFYFLDEAFHETFKDETRLSGMFSVFTVLAIFIACMGLFGLVTFTAKSRTKEIGIRKVLGASVTGIVGMLSQEFVKLVLVAGVIATPVAWYLMSRWLQDFAYKINIPFWICLSTIGFMLAITLLTICFKTVQAALMNPVKSLGSE